ncbi:hypothetical protein Nmel_009498 [Mimus melanotis]
MSSVPDCPSLPSPPVPGGRAGPGRSGTRCSGLISHLAAFTGVVGLSVSPRPSLSFFLSLPANSRFPAASLPLPALSPSMAIPAPLPTTFLSRSWRKEDICVNLNPCAYSSATSFKWRGGGGGGLEEDGDTQQQQQQQKTQRQENVD